MLVELRIICLSPQSNSTTTSIGAQTKMPSQSAVRVKLTMKGLYKKIKIQIKTKLLGMNPSIQNTVHERNSQHVAYSVPSCFI